MKQRFLDSWPRDWVKYLVIVVVSVALWMWVFGVYHAPKETEKLEVFFGGVVKDYDFEEVAADAVDGVKKVTLSVAYPWAGNAFDQKYSVVALTVSDVVIVPEKVAKETDCKRAFAELSVGVPFVQEGVQYGAYLPAARKEELSAYFAFEYEEYVVFAVASSPNAGQATNHSFELIEWLLG